MGFGGPVWHASAAHADPKTLRILALSALQGVGDSNLGEWEEWTGNAYHVRRRLTNEEMNYTGPAVDVRGTQEAARRLARVSQWLPPGYVEK